ncbi:MAG: cupin domain-containing protein [Alphaproteobacteria bacterium]|nr:cupin domain-containing protein [Alphaproteobacteria bacterium]
MAREHDQRLLSGILSFVAAHRDPAVGRFKDAMANWGTDWRAAPAQHLPAADTLRATMDLATAETRPLVALFEAENATRKWEQSYTKADGVVGDDMLAGYGFAEVIGKLGPFVSTKVRSGVGVFGRNINYPPHNHAAEEVYILLAGSAEFMLEGGPYERRQAGDVVHVSPMRRHGFRTTEHPLAVFYIWQAGDLRQKSSFK